MFAISLVAGFLLFRLRLPRALRGLRYRKSCRLRASRFKGRLSGFPVGVQSYSLRN